MTQDLVQILPVFISSDIIVVNGANLGDAISFADELDLDDVYEVRLTATAQRLTVAVRKDGSIAIASGSILGRAGHAVYLDATVTMMSSTGTTTELLVMVEVDNVGDVDAIYALPLSPLTPRSDYTLVGIDRPGARARFSEAACLSNQRGSHADIAPDVQIAS